jgi:2-dehydro-3-deoxyphosphooctonate aldolase (KDO 8-P synthase)
VAEVVDVLQTPAFLCRQTNFMQRVAACAKTINIKKGQFLSPWEMKHVVEKVRAVSDAQVMVCERGASFGYNNLVSDMRSLVVMRDTGCPVVFDATHSVQLPGAGNGQSLGQREFVAPLARAAVAVGISGLFMETHPCPASPPRNAYQTLNCYTQKMPLFHTPSPAHHSQLVPFQQHASFPKAKETDLS